MRDRVCAPSRDEFALMSDYACTAFYKYGYAETFDRAIHLQTRFEIISVTRAEKIERRYRLMDFQL